MRALSWNLFHGRDSPPDPALFTWRSRLLRVSERNADHVQLNRPLLREFAEVLGALEWDVALLQEAPPLWAGALRRELQADGAATLTSRNSLGRLRRLAADLNPDLIASNEGGSNQLLVRPPWRVAEVREHTLAERPERRRMLWARLSAGGRELAVANLHGSVDRVPTGAREVIDAAARAVDWAGPLPLLFGGDLNLRPARAPDAFAELADRFGLAPPTDAEAIDHLLARGLAIGDPPRRLPPEARELRCADGRRLRLSDHAPVAGRFRMK